MIDDEYQYEIIDKHEDGRRVAMIIAEEFVTHNPFSIFNKETCHEFFEDVSWPLVRDLIDEKLSMLVRHRLSQEIVGIIAAGDFFLFHRKPDLKEKSLTQPNAVADLFEELDNNFVYHDFCQELKPNLVLQIVFVAFRSHHSGQGLATRLSKILCDYARDSKGFRYAFVQTTHPSTEKIYVEKMGGQVLSACDVTTWLWKKTDGSTYPFREYQGRSIPNILIDLFTLKT